MRELCVQLDKAKDAHSRQVATVSSELEQVLCSALLSMIIAVIVHSCKDK